MLRLALLSLIGVLLAAPARADLLVYTWDGTLTGYGPYYEPLIPPDTPVTIKLFFDEDAPNTCPSPQRERAGNFSGVWATMEILGWRYHSGFAFFEFRSPRGGCGGSPDWWRIFIAGSFNNYPPDQLDPQAGPPITWRFEQFWQLDWSTVSVAGLVPALPRETTPPERGAIQGPAHTGPPPARERWGVRGSGGLTVWVWTPDSSDHLVW